MSKRVVLPRYIGRPLVITIAAVAAAATGAVLATTAAMARPAQIVTTGLAHPVATTSICRAAALHLQELGTDTAVGTTAMTVAVINRSARACQLAGYPALHLMDPGGHAVSTAARPGTGGIFGRAAGAVRLAPRAKASFFFVYRGFQPATGRPCTATRELMVRLPGVPGDFRLTAALAACGPVSVSALRPGAAKE
jgi:Protein of unknown function (DUF4232)